MAGAEKETGPASAGLRLLAGAIAICAPAPAFAGAWIAPKNGQEIWSNVAGKRDGLNYYETSGYLEAPLGEHNALVISPWIEQSYTDGSDGWRIEATAALKHTILRTEHTAMAVQAGALWVSGPPQHCSEGGAELRWLGGVNLPHRTFVNLEAASRTLTGGCTDQRMDLTLGAHAGHHWLALAQVYADGPRYSDETIKAQLSLVRLGDNGRGIQIGFRDRIDGGAPEPALVIGFWSEPGRAQRRRD